MIYLDRKNRDVLETIVDLEEFEKVITFPYKWYAQYDIYSKSFYAVATVYNGMNANPSRQRMHKLILNYEGHLRVDHKNHNTLDNRKENLRIIVSDKNSANRKGANCNNKTGFRNVHLVTRYGGKQLYLVQIMKKGERYMWEFGLNEFDEACRFAEEKRKELFGEYAGNG